MKKVLLSKFHENFRKKHMKDSALIYIFWGRGRRNRFNINNTFCIRAAEHIIDFHAHRVRNDISDLLESIEDGVNQSVVLDYPLPAFQTVTAYDIVRRLNLEMTTPSDIERI